VNGGRYGQVEGKCHRDHERRDRDGDRGERESSDDFSFISSEKAEEYFKDTPDAIENTTKIAEMCTIEIVLGQATWKFPNFIVEDGLSYDEELKKITYEGITTRGLEKTKEVTDRIEYELGIIVDMGFSGYFLIVSDFINWAKSNGIPVGPGRGSAAGARSHGFRGMVSSVVPSTSGRLITGM